MENAAAPRKLLPAQRSSKFDPLKLTIAEGLQRDPDASAVMIAQRH